MTINDKAALKVLPAGPLRKCPLEQKEAFFRAVQTFIQATAACPI